MIFHNVKKKKKSHKKQPTKKPLPFLLVFYFFPHLSTETLMNDKQINQFIEAKQAATDKFEPCRVQVTSVKQTLLTMILLLLITSRLRKKKK